MPAKSSISISITVSKIQSKGKRVPALRATQNWQTYLFRKIVLHMSFGLPGPLQTAFEQTKLKTSANKYARCGYNNVTCT